jgi:hypothetical protein
VLAHLRGEYARLPPRGHNGPVRFRIGTAAALGIGYVLGTRAGRERYLQITRMAGAAARSAPVTSTASLVGHKSRAVVTLGVERAKDAIGVRLGWRNADQAADAIALDLAEDLASALNGRARWSDPVAQVRLPAGPDPARSPAGSRRHASSIRHASSR